MSSQRFGTVTRVDRTNQQVEVMMPAVGQPRVIPYMGDPPAPLAAAEVIKTGTGSYMCLGSIGDVRRVFHDDFLEVNTESGDSPWRQIGTLGTVAQASSPVVGAALLTTTSTSMQRLGLSKDNQSVVPSTTALWMNGQFTIGALTNAIYWIGLMSDGLQTFTPAATDAGAFLAFDSAAEATWQGKVYGGTVGFINGVALGGSTLTTVTFDMVLLGGAFAAFWINGDGPYWTDSNVIPSIPPASTSGACQPGVVVAPRTTTPATLQVEWLELNTVLSVLSPRELLQLPPRQPFILNDPVRGILNTNDLG